MNNNGLKTIQNLPIGFQIRVYYALNIIGYNRRTSLLLLKTEREIKMKMRLETLFLLCISRNEKDFFHNDISLLSLFHSFCVIFLINAKTIFFKEIK